MTTLITGGGSQTGTALAQLLVSANHKVLFGSRSGRVPDGYDVVKFDWEDDSTFDGPFKADRNIEYVFLVSPFGYLDPLPLMQSFIELAIKNGVKRYVFLSGASDVDRGTESVNFARVHSYLKTKGLDYVILRPTWFLGESNTRNLRIPYLPIGKTENFLRMHGNSIKGQGVIETTAPNGKIPFVAVDDIARAAFDSIANRDALPSNEPYLFGPDLISYSEIALIFSSVLGRTISHRTISRETSLARLTEFGVPEDYATFLLDLEEGSENGFEEKIFSSPHTLVGMVSPREWIEKNREAFGTGQA